jgi:homoserine acetyltransferase
MANTTNKYENIPVEKLRFAKKSDALHDKKLSTKPVSYFQGAFRRFAKHNIPFILFSINTDCCFSSRDISLFHRRLLKNGVQAEYTRISSEKGHDSFLLEPELYEAGITAYLNKV